MNAADEHRFGGPWTVEKLNVLRDYLAAYTKVLLKQPLTRNYIDAFAGTGGRTTQRDEAQTLLELPELDVMTKGSAKLALEVEPPFHHYVFIEKRKSRTGVLEHLKEEFPSRNITVEHEDANEALQRICRTMDWRTNRALVFLDPYGMQVDWATLCAIASTRATDMWVLYPSGMGMNRLLTKSGEIRKEWQDTLDRFLGCSDWRTAFYRLVEGTDLFGETTVDRVKDGSTAKFEAFFLDRLRSIFAGVAPRGLPLVNSRGQVMYLLCFAVANPRGKDIALRIANSVMKKPR